MNNSSNYKTETWTQTGPHTWSLTSPYYINPARQISELESLADHWRQKALIDDLTELPNRLALKMHMEEGQKEKLEDYRRNSLDTSIVFVDLNDFGSINKKYGDHNGDIALKTVASSIYEAIREDDRLFRKGGDEFILILNGAGVDDANQTVAKDLEARLTNGIDVTLAEGNVIQVKASIGVFDYSPDKPLVVNIAEADTKMRRAKTQCKLEEARKLPDPSP